MILPIVHTPGRHCASVGLADLVNHHGLGVSEAFCFGVGLGLGIWYLDFPGLGASRVVHVRSQDIEAQFFTRMGMDFAWEQFDDPADSEEALKEAIAQGRPALIQSDIFHLPYYGSSTHFPGHVIVVWGFDDQSGEFVVTDTERPRPQRVPYAAMRKARYSDNAFFNMKGNQFAPSSIPKPEDLPVIAARAIADQSRGIIAPAAPFGGLPGLARWQKELSLWPDFEDWQWTARFAYQVIEKRGTGGGGFRLMYADFLEEAGAMLPEVRERGLAQKMRALGLAWTDLSFALKEASERETPQFSPVAEKLDMVAAQARAYHREAANIQIPESP